MYEAYGKSVNHYHQTNGRFQQIASVKLKIMTSWYVQEYCLCVCPLIQLQRLCIVSWYRIYLHLPTLFQWGGKLGPNMWPTRAWLMFMLMTMKKIDKFQKLICMQFVTSKSIWPHYREHKDNIKNILFSYSQQSVNATNAYHAAYSLSG